MQRLHDSGEWIRSGEPILRMVHLNELKVEAYVPIDGISVAALQGTPMKVAVRLSEKDVASYETQVEFVRRGDRIAECPCFCSHSESTSRWGLAAPRRYGRFH